MARHPGRTMMAALASVACLFFLFAGTVFFVVVTGLRNSAPAWLAMEKAAQNPAVLEELGQPLRERWLVQGRIHTGNSPASASGHAQLKIPVAGPRGTARIEATAEKHSGRWDLTACTITFEDDSDSVDLLNTPAPDQAISQAPAH